MISEAKLNSQYRFLLNNIQFLESIRDESYELPVNKMERIDNFDPDFFSLKTEGNNDQLAVEITDYVKYTASGLAFLNKLEN